jgi:hypothetical protein
VQDTAASDEAEDTTDDTAVETAVDDADTVNDDADDASDDAGTSANTDVSDADDDGETVLDDGEVVMEGALGKLDESEWITKDDYTVIAENDTYTMYFYEPRLSFALENKETGAVLESTLSDALDDGNSNTTWNAYMKSGVVATAIVGTNNTYQVDLITCNNTVDVTYLDNGFSAEVYFTDYQFGFTVQVTLEDEDVVITVPEDSIVENKEGTYIATISLYPFFGYTFMDDQDGYMLIPDGNGALIYLDNKEGRYTTGFSQMVYGSDDGFTSSSTSSKLWDKYETVVDSNLVLAPVFGMAHLDDQIGYIAVIEDGQMRASVEAQPNGAMVNYNRCFAKFLLRDVYTQPLNQSNSGTVQMAETDRIHSDLTVRYMLLTGDDANYSGMAVRYRSYLLDNGLMTKQDSSYNTRVDFLGTDREEFLMGTRAVTMTTTDDIETMYEELQDAGVSSLLSIYKGWQKGGVFSLPIKKYKADSKIGGTSSLTDLIESAEEENYKIYLYNDALEINASTNATTFNAAKMVNKRTLTVETTQQVYDTYYYLLPNKTETTLSNFVKSYTKKGVSNLAVAGISNTLFSYSQKGNYFNRYDTANYYEETLAAIDESTNLILEQPFSYLWNYTEAFLDMPLGASDYMYADEEIPFLSMVLKGTIPMYSDYVNFEANKSEFFLQMVESGVYPSFYITYENSSKLIYTNSSDLYSTEYATYKNMIVEYDEQLREVADAVTDSYIMKHEKLDNGVTKVTYDNGVVIYVNYSESDVTVDGYTVGAMSYEIGGAK